MLIDAFIFFNEKELVELRLKYLNSINPMSKETEIMIIKNLVED